MPMWPAVGVAHAHGGAQHGDVEHQHHGKGLGPGRRVVEYVAAEHLQRDRGNDGDKAGHRDNHAGLGQGGAKAGEHRGILQYGLSASLTSMSFRALRGICF